MLSSIAKPLKKKKTTTTTSLSRTLKGHTEAVLSVEFSPNGRHVLTGSKDKTAKLWKVNDETVVHTFQGHESWIVSVAFSPDGQYVLTRSWDRTAKLWNVQDGTVVHTFEAHFVYSAVFSPNGQSVLTGSTDKTAKLWNVNDGTVVHTFEGHKDFVNSVTFSPDGQHVLTGSWDKTAKLWNVNDGKVVHTFEGHTDYVTFVAFSPNGQHVLTGSKDKTAKLWNVNDGTVVHTCEGHTNYVKSVAFSPDGQSVLTGSSDNTAKLWNVNDGTAEHTFEGHGDYFWSVAFSPDGQHVLTGCEDKTAKLWNVNDGTAVHAFQGHTEYVTSVAFSPDGQYVLTGSWEETARLWQVPKSLVTSTNHPESVSPSSTSGVVTDSQQTIQTLASPPDGQHVLTGSVDNTVKLWQLPKTVVACTNHPESVSPLSTSNVIRNPQQTSQTITYPIETKSASSSLSTSTKTILDFKGHTHYVSSVAISLNGQYALTGSFDNTAKLWNVIDGTSVHAFQGHTDSVRSVAFSPTGQDALTGSDDKTAKLWNIYDGNVVHTFQGHTNCVSSVAFSPNGQYALTGSLDKTAKLWNINDGTVAHAFQGHTSSVWSVAFSPNGQFVLTGSGDETAILWNVNNGTVVQIFRGHTDYVWSVAFLQNGQYILTGSEDKTAKLWNVNNGIVVHTFQGHRDSVRSVAFSPDGRNILTGSFDKTAKLWNVNDGTVLHTFQGHRDSVKSVAFSPNGKHLLTGSYDKTAKLWLLPKSVVAPTNHPESVHPLSISNIVTNPQQTIQTFSSHSNPFSPSFSNDVNVIPTPDPVPETTFTSDKPLQAYDSVNIVLVNKLHEQGDRFLDIINNASTMESDMYDLLSQYPKELQSLLYEKSQSDLEKKELNAIMRSQEHYQFYTHFIRKLKGMMTACETINSGMVSQADMSFQDYVHGLVKEGSWIALQQIGLGKVLGGVIQWAKKQFASVPFTDAIGSFFQMACEFKNKRDQHLDIGRVAIMSALADIQEHDRGGVNGTVHRIGRYILRAERNQLSLLESDEFGRMEKLWTKAMGESANTPAKERGCNVADLVIGDIMNPTKNTDLYNILEGHTINQSASLDEIIAASALDMTIEDIQNLQFFASEEDNTDDLISSPADQYSDNFELFNTLGMSVTENNIPSNTSSNNASGIATIEEVERMKKTMLEMQKQNESLRRKVDDVQIKYDDVQMKYDDVQMKYDDVQMKYDDVQMKYEIVTKQVTKLNNEKKETEVGVGGGLAQAYVNPYETSGQETSVVNRLDQHDQLLASMQSNQVEVNRTTDEHEERFHLVDKKMKGLLQEDDDDKWFSREAAEEKRKREKEKREKEEKRKRIERERRELLD